MGQMYCNESLSLLKFYKRFRTKKLVRKTCFSCFSLKVIGALVVSPSRLTFSKGVIFCLQRLWLPASADGLRYEPPC